ncbi:uncharacterized protein LOC114932026 [Nylanderia fulva]|uniref:uncharacterized protein LOC114932026 n=1 Tax=Nylanderia fulva TaxID=613905 RepID=UPI0010FB446F|nr:uncharacterized protein LOC114932026 [Nylanderia fulva]
MPRQCRDLKCIANKEKLTVHKYKNKEKDPRPISYRNSLSNSTASQSKKQKCTKPKSTYSRDGSKNHIYLICVYSMKNLKSSTPERISSRSQNYTEQICTCGKRRRDPQSGGLHKHVNSQNVSTERSKKKRKKSRRRHKKASRRESDQPRHDCFTTLCVCVRGRSSNKLRACKCTSSREILSSDHECCCVKDGRKKRRNRPTNILRNDIQTGRHTADPSTSERKHPDELLQEKAKLAEERNVIIKGLDTIRKGINRFGAHTIKIFESKN